MWCCPSVFPISVNGTIAYPVGRAKTLLKPKADHAIAPQHSQWVSHHTWKKKSQSSFRDYGNVICYHLSSGSLHSIYTCLQMFFRCPGIPAHLRAFPLVLWAWNSRPRGMRQAHSLASLITLLKCYLLREVFSNHPSITSLLSYIIYL